jgi:hypothetical protein
VTDEQSVLTREGGLREKWPKRVRNERAVDEHDRVTSDDAFVREREAIDNHLIHHGSRLHTDSIVCVDILIRANNRPPHGSPQVISAKEKHHPPAFCAERAKSTR